MRATTRSTCRPAKTRATTILRQAQDRLKTEANAGRIAGVFGLRGELKLAASRVGEDALAEGVELRARLPGGETREVRVRSLRRHQGRPLIAFEGVEDAGAAQAFAGATLMIDRAGVELAAGEYFDDDLVGCTLVDARGVALGEVVGVEHYPAQDVLLIGASRAMVPLVGAFVKAVDVAAKRIAVDLPPGLIDAREADEA